MDSFTFYGAIDLANAYFSIPIGRNGKERAENIGNH